MAQYFELIPYLDPQHLKNPKKFFKDEIISDIYSLGVLLWEISTQEPPFENFAEEPCLLFYLIVYEDFVKHQIRVHHNFMRTYMKVIIFMSKYI